jgi:hypothetical protein
VVDRVSRIIDYGNGVVEQATVDLPADVEELVTREEQSGGNLRETVLGGGRTFYQGLVYPTAFEIQFARTRVFAGTYTKVRTFLVSGGAGGDTIRVGTYSNVSNDPNARQAQGSRVLVVEDNGEIVDVALDAPLVVETPTLFWISFSCTSAAPRFVGTMGGLRGKFHPVRFQTTADGILPVTATPLKTVGAIVFAALVP